MANHDRVTRPAEAMESMLRERLRSQAGDALREMWARMPREELTPEIEQEIVEEVRALRAEPSFRKEAEAKMARWRETVGRSRNGRYPILPAHE